MGIDPQIRADQMGHGIGVNLEAFTSTKLDQLTAATAKFEAWLLEATGCL
jgi:hypothetical protein